MQLNFHVLHMLFILVHHIPRKIVMQMHLVREECIHSFYFIKAIVNAQVFSTDDNTT